MALSLTSEFTLQDIDAIRVFKKGAVYLLQGGGQELVVKKEPISSANAKHFELSRKAMGVVDKNVKDSQRLSENEVKVLQIYVGNQRAAVQFRLMNRLPGASEDLETAIGDLKKAQFVWFKMQKVNMLTLREAWDAKLGIIEETGEQVAQSDEPMRVFLKTLRAPNGLEALGQIIAIDLFSGNRDRINPRGASTSMYPGAKVRLKVVKNVGNLMIVRKGGARTITGMDFADPYSPQLLADDALDTQSASAGNEWFGHDLADATKRKRFVKNVVSDLETIFTSGGLKKRKDFFGRTSSDQTALGNDAGVRLEKGMLKGAKVLVKYIDGRLVKNKQYPPSFLERLTIFRNVV